MAATPKLTDRVKMIYLIRRRREVSRDELIMHWFKNHMPAVIASQVSAEKSGRDHANKYIAQLFANADQYEGGWDGMAQLWYQNPLPVAITAHGRAPTDTFQEKAEPYNAWATREYVIRDGSDQLPAEPLTLNEPYPSTRTGFYRLNYLVAAKDGHCARRVFQALARSTCTKCRQRAGEDQGHPLCRQPQHQPRCSTVRRDGRTLFSR